MQFAVPSESGQNITLNPRVKMVEWDEKVVDLKEDKKEKEAIKFSNYYEIEYSIFKALKDNTDDFSVELLINQNEEKIEFEKNKDGEYVSKTSIKNLITTKEFNNLQ